MLTAEVRREYARIRNSGDRGGIVGEAATWALKDARTRVQFREMERMGLVRINAEHEEEDYFSVYGEPDTEKEREQIRGSIEMWGCVCVMAQVRDSDDDEWETVGSIGMCIYSRPCDPDDNSYVDDLMRSALEYHGV